MASPAFRNRERNPYNWLLYSHLAELGVEVRELSERDLARGRANIWHVHWPEHMVNGPLRDATRRVLRFWASLLIARARGVAVVYTVHNLQSHAPDRPWLDSIQRMVVTRGVSATMHLSEQARTAAFDRFPRLRKKPSFVVPHGHYRSVYPQTMGRAEARATFQLSDDTRVIGYVGLVRAYKGVLELVQAFRTVRDDTLALVVAGRAEPPEHATALREAAGGDPRIRMELAFIADEELQRYYGACDLVVLPFRQILNSGSALLALSFGRPILVPDIGSFRDLQEQVGSDWVRLYTGDLTPELLEREITLARSTAAASAPDLTAFDWGNIALATRQAYEAVISGR